jgi:hypothetical protein
MSEAQRRIAEHEALMRELVDNDPLFKVFTVVEAGPSGRREGRRFVLVKREDGAGIQMPEPGAE